LPEVVIRSVRLTDNPEQTDDHHDAIERPALRAEFVSKRQFRRTD
jgi:uncharacterized Zn ribbon protein